MSPLNRGSLLGPRVPPVGIRPLPPPRFGGRLPPPGLPPRMPPPPMNPVFGPMRQRLPPPPRPGGVARLPGPIPLFGPRGRGIAPVVPPMGLRGAGPRGLPMRPWPRRVLPPQIMQHMRPRFIIRNGNLKGKALNNVKKENQLEELELKKPWMTDEIRREIQKKNKLYAKAKKNKDAKEWEEFKDLRNKVTRMIRDAKNDYLTRHPERAHLYPDDDDVYDQRDENDSSSEEDTAHYCEVCDRDFPSEDSLIEHKIQHKLCGIDGCTFSAHPMLVERHISMQHSTGLYQRMKNLSTPEDIEKWLTERKKKYPTKANIELRQAAETEKVQRGEIIKQNQDAPKHKPRSSMNSGDRKRKVQRRSAKVVRDVPLQVNELYRGIQAFAGTLTLEENHSNVDYLKEEMIENTGCESNINHISDEEETPPAKTEPVITKFSIPSLVADYGTDSDDDGPEEIAIRKTKNEDEDQINAIHKNVVGSKMESHTRLNTDSEKLSTQQLPALMSTNKKQPRGKQHPVAPRQRKGNDKVPAPRKQPKRLQLLQRLLSRSMQHERNLICQCVKYIVDNNYFT